MNVSSQVKRYFHRLEFYEILEDPIILSDESREINECRENRWSFGVNLNRCNKGDILAFYHAIIDARRKYINEHKIKTKLVFYTWYDPMAGNFYFSIIPQDWPELDPGQEFPFGSTVNKVKSLDIIIENFINDPYKGAIPIEEFEEVDLLEESPEEEDLSKYVVDVWSIIL
jgi:hypothetical protein